MAGPGKREPFRDTRQWLRTTLLVALETVINGALKYDEATQARLSRLEGTLLALETRSPFFRVYLLVVADGVECYAECDASPDVRIEAPTLELLKQWLQAESRGSPIGGPLKITGDTRLVQELQDILQGLEIDWEEPLSHWIGDVAAHQLGHGLRQFATWARESLGSLMASTEEFLHHEASLLPTRREVTEFMRDVDDLRMDYDRLAAKVARLKQQWEKE